MNLAHQGMGDVMGGILADCLVGLPLMRELNLRDNRLTDKGLMPIVKVRVKSYLTGVSSRQSIVRRLNRLEKPETFNAQPFETTRSRNMLLGAKLPQVNTPTRSGDASIKRTARDVVWLASQPRIRCCACWPGVPYVARNETESETVR